MRKPLFIVLSLFLFITACTKIQTTDIGNGLIPPVDGVTTFDTTVDLITNTFIDTSDALVYKSDDQVIGVISDDPLFGKTEASSFFELKPPFYKFGFDQKQEDLTPDSAVLILSYRGVYGDSTKPQTWRVFEIDPRDTLTYNKNYAANKTTIRYGNQIGVKSNFDIRSLKDSLRLRFERAANQVRITLSPTFAAKMIKTFDTSENSATNAYYSDSTFRRSLAGFAVVPDMGSGNALVSVNLLDTNTKLALYYSFKTATTPARDTASVTYFRFKTNEGKLNSGSANIIKRDRTGSAVARNLNSGKNDSLVFVQTSPGTYVQIRIPDLHLFPNSIIHRAEFVAEQEPSTNTMLDSYLSPPRYLLLSAWDSAKNVKRNIPNDFTVDAQGFASNITTFGGFLSYKDAGTSRFATYDFNLTRYVQGIVTRRDTSFQLRLSAPSNDTLRYRDPYPANIFNTFYIVPGAANVIANGRVQLGGGSGDKKRPHRMRLRIIYSKL